MGIVDAWSRRRDREARRERYERAAAAYARVEGLLESCDRLAAGLEDESERPASARARSLLTKGAYQAIAHGSPEQQAEQLGVLASRLRHPFHTEPLFGAEFVVDLRRDELPSISKLLDPVELGRLRDETDLLWAEREHRAIGDIQALCERFVSEQLGSATAYIDVIDSDDAHLAHMIGRMEEIVSGLELEHHELERRARDEDDDRAHEDRLHEIDRGIAIRREVMENIYLQSE